MTWFVTSQGEPHECCNPDAREVHNGDASTGAGDGAGRAPAAEPAELPPPVRRHTPLVERYGDEIAEFFRQLIPVVFGLALFVVAWAIISQSSTLPGPVKTWHSAVQVFGDPFYRKGPNDQGIGWNILNSLGRVGIGFGLAALIGIPLGFMISRLGSSQHDLADRQPLRPCIAARVAADRAARVQGRESGRVTGHIHLEHLAMIVTPAGVRSAAGLSERRKSVEPLEWKVFTRILFLRYCLSC